MQNVKTVIEAVNARFFPEYKGYIQDGKNFRYDVATIKPYKGNRDKTHKPKYYKEIKTYLLDQWGAIGVDGMESDDAIAIEQFNHPDRSTVIVSIDKDMMCCPGYHFNWVKNELRYQPIKEANLFHFYQMLVGDTTDNIPGINKIGDKRATKLIEELGRDEDRVRQAVHELYQKQYGPDWQAAYDEVSRLLYILRKPEELEAGCPFRYG